MFKRNSPPEVKSVKPVGEVKPAYGTLRANIMYQPEHIYVSDDPETYDQDEYWLVSLEEWNGQYFRGVHNYSGWVKQCKTMQEASDYGKQVICDYRTHKANQLLRNQMIEQNSFTVSESEANCS